MGYIRAYHFEGDEKKTNTPGAEYQKNLKALIKLSMKHADKVLFMGIFPVDNARVQPVPWHKEISYSYENCRKYNELAKNVCKKANVPFLDIFGTFSKTSYKKLLADGVHPTSEGHKKIFEMVLQFLKENEVLS